MRILKKSMTLELFETLKYNISDNTDMLLDDFCDQDVIFFNSLDTPHLMLGELHNFLDRTSFQSCKYLTANEILYKKQLRFQKGHSTEHAIIHVIDQINNSFVKIHFTLGNFIDHSKAFDTVDHSILIKN